MPPCRVLGCGSPAAHQGEVSPGPGPQCSLRLPACHANAWPVAAEQPGCPQRRAGCFPSRASGAGSHLGALVPAPARAAAPSFLTQRAEPPQAPHLLWPMARVARSPWGSRWLTNTFPLVFSTGEGCSVLTSAVPKGAVPSDVGHWKNFISPAGVGGRSVFYSGRALGVGIGAGVREAAQGLQGLASGP